MWSSFRGKISRDRASKEPDSPVSPELAAVEEKPRDQRYASGQFFFEYLVVVSLKKNIRSGEYEPQISYQFPKRDGMVRFQKEEEEKTLKAITLFCFPEGINWAPLTEYRSETFSFVLTEIDGSRRNGYCRRLLPHGNGARLPEAYCIISKLACFGLFSKIFDEVEKRKVKSIAMIYPFMQSLREAPFPAPGNTVNIKSFIPESGTECIPTEVCVCVCLQIGDEDSILPHKLRDEILQALKSRSEKATLEEMNRVVPEAFLPFFIKTVGHFAKHIARPGPEKPGQFQKRSFYKALESKSTRHFVKKFVETQMFDLFIQEAEQRPANQNGKFTKYSKKFLQ
uniref:DENN/MADD domain containing 2Da n=1 Tax=Astyanax mexicanus TaxID=7994 RepID=A0A8B9L522_ASTMX